MAWQLEPGIDFLNHGSFGAAPIAVTDRQQELRRRLEAEPVRFFQRQREALYDAAREELGAFVGAAPDDIAFVANATTGVNAVLRSLSLREGDELLVTDHAYNACRNALDYVAARAGATVTVASIPFPIEHPGDAVEAVTSKVTEATRLALLDHVTSPTALVMPIVELTRALRERGVLVLIDGAHAPGMVHLDVEAIGADFYAGNCHKWICAPKGAGFLWVLPEHQEWVVPTVISHGANSPRTDRSRFRLLFDWVGTEDPTPHLSVSTAIATIAEMHPGGWHGVMDRNRAMAIAARDALVQALGIEPPAPDDMLGSMAAVPLPDASGPPPTDRDPFQAVLFAQGFEVPIVVWRSWPQRLIRISAHLYNEAGQYRRLADTLSRLLAEP